MEAQATIQAISKNATKQVEDGLIWHWDILTV